MCFFPFGSKASPKAEGPHNYPHPGFAWAMTRKAYERAGGLYDLSILGSGDHNMALAWGGRAKDSLNGLVHNSYKETLLRFEATTSTAARKTDGITAGGRSW